MSIFAKILYFWSLTVPICRSGVPEFKSGIETEPNRPNGTEPNRPNGVKNQGFEGRNCQNTKSKKSQKSPQMLRYPFVLYGCFFCFFGEHVSFPIGCFRCFGDFPYWCCCFVVNTAVFLLVCWFLGDNSNFPIVVFCSSLVLL